MGRAIQMENDIEQLRIEVMKLQERIETIGNIVSEIIELAKGDSGGKKKSTKKKASKASDGAKDNISDK